MTAEKVRDLRLSTASATKQLTVAQDFDELIDASVRLNQFDDVRIRHSISFLRWRSGLQLPSRYAAFLIYNVINLRPYFPLQ